MAFAVAGASDDLIQMALLGEALDYAAVAVFVFDEDVNSSPSTARAAS